MVWRSKKVTWYSVQYLQLLWWFVSLGVHRKGSQRLEPLAGAGWQEDSGGVKERQKNRKRGQGCKMPRNNIIISWKKMRASMAYVGQMNFTIWVQEYTAWMSYRSLAVGVGQDAMNADRPLMDGIEIHPELLYLFVTGTKTAPGVVPFGVLLWERKWMWRLIRKYYIFL